MSTPPNCSTAAATTAAAPSAVVTSATTPIARPGPAIDAHRGVELVCSARAEDDVCALVREARRDPAADAPARAGHDRDFAGEPEVHARS